MKEMRLAFMALFIVFLLMACALDNNEGIAENSITPPASTPDELPLNKVEINPSRGYYDIVVVDIDRWEICLNHNRIRRNVTSYHGHLWYQAGRYIFEGSAAAMYNPYWDQLTVIALDSGWDRGHIMYNLKFEDETGTDMHGTFVYYEHPRRCNWVDAWLDQGRIGEHDAGPYPGNRLAKEGMPEYVPSGHLKKDRIDDMDDMILPEGR